MPIILLKRYIKSCIFFVAVEFVEKAKLIQKLKVKKNISVERKMLAVDLLRDERHATQGSECIVYIS